MTTAPSDQVANRRTLWWAYPLLGTLFGVILIQSEAASWFRIQEMFRFQGFQLYGVIGSAVITSALAIRLLRRRRAASGTPIEVPDKRWCEGSQHRYWIGGLLFGVGWGLVGSCPGPIYALMGFGSGGAVVVLLAALLGTRTYAAVADRLPH